jgi:N-acetylglutamate synthase/N-acetylornithine aminotransferase
MLTTLLRGYLHRLWLKRLFTEKMQSTHISSFCFYFSLTFLLLSSSWGRILAATGSVSFLPSSTGAPAPTIDPTKVNVIFLPSDGTTPLPVLVNGEPEKVNEERAKEILSLEDFEVLVDLGMQGDGEARYWTCDFSYVS